MSIWDIYKKANPEGQKVEGLNARYFTGVENATALSVHSPEYFWLMSAFYFVGLSTYWFCTKNGMRAQRLYSSVIMAAVPIITLSHLKGDENRTGLLHHQSLQERLEFYPATKRALERAINDLSKDN